MLFFKRQWPIIVAFALGIVMWARYYIPTAESQTLQDEFVHWDRIIYGFAGILGLLSLLHHHYNKIKLKRPGFGFSYITICAFIVMALTGLLPIHFPGFAGMQNQSTGLHMWLFNNMFVPMQSTMFSVLAFFIASAAFRAFRARSAEATALLVAACIMMIGRVPLGESLIDLLHQHLPHVGFFGHGFQALNYQDWNAAKDAGQSCFEINKIYDFPAIASWLLNVPNAAAQRGILLGVILSQIAISVRIIFGIERTYMGGGD
jgi:hypothetical protein